VAKKLYYKIGEACKILEVKPFVLRYWETEFPFLSPDKSKSGQRIYSERDLELVRRINELLNVEGYTIAGARKKLQAELEADGRNPGSGNGPRPAAPLAAVPPSEAPPPAARPAAVPALDTAARERVEQFRSGVEEALRQARDLLELLGEESSRAEKKTSKTGAR